MGKIDDGGTQRPPGADRWTHADQDGCTGPRARQVGTENARRSRAKEEEDAFEEAPANRGKFSIY